MLPSKRPNVIMCLIYICTILHSLETLDFEREKNILVEHVGLKLLDKIWGVSIYL